MNPNNNRKNKNHKSRSVQINKTVTLLVLFCLCIGGISMVAAKYMKQNTTKNNAAGAKEFYFESDLLDGKEYVIMPTDNRKANVTIRLKNYIDDLRYSETDIEYTVKVAEKDSRDSATGVTINPKTGTIKAGTKSKQDIEISNLQAGKTYTITATTDNIYKKILTGTIKVSEPDTKVYASVHDENQYIEVTIWTKDYEGEVRLKYSETNLIPDNTDEKMKDATTDGSSIVETNWGANTSHVYRFFKNNETKKYQVTVNDKEVTVSEKTE